MMFLQSQILQFIKLLNEFDYQISGRERIWNIIFPEKRKWQHLFITQYQETYYINSIDESLPPLELHPEKLELTNKHWQKQISLAMDWMKRVKDDWISENKLIQQRYPLKFRQGIIPASLVRALIPDIYRIDHELGESNVKTFIDLVEKGYFWRTENKVCSLMTAERFFEYCKIAYIAAQSVENPIDPHLSGRELYKIFADGRDEGLLEISPDSPEEFSEWLDGKHPKRTPGGHPWEIKRGGNTTHIDLFVSRPYDFEKKDFTVTLNGPAISRLKETILMFLALHDAGFSINICDPEGIRLRILGRDNIGVIPCFDSLHRANQRFRDHQSVYDVLYFDDFGKQKARAKPFITWEPLHIFKPRDK